MGSWYAGYEKEVVQQLKGTRERDLRFFRIEEYLRMAERADEFSDSCRECHSLCFPMERQKDSLAKAVQEPGRERRELDRLQSKMSDHMKQQHGFYPPYYFTYLHSFTWTVLLMCFAFIASLFFPDADRWYFLAPAFAAGVLSGQITGSRKDRKIRADKKNL